ncbi:MAG TPA: putative baseplate assembly protein [Pyrinomonadaceae bacterium]|nr:putative baseplate assembly protein [Pyrinomonadaceae bacterium]
MIYFCCDEKRRNAVEAHATLNGIEFLEVSDDPADPVEVRQRTLFVHFLKDLAAGALIIENLTVEGGERIRPVKVTKVTIGPSGDDRVLAVEVAEPGDFSTYTLRLVKVGEPESPPDDFDPVLSAIEFSFKVACPSDFDCREEKVCPPEHAVSPQIDYLAKDYQSLRRLMLDRMSVLMPEWRERNAADFGVALVEMLAYVGDYLSYRQDAVATEAYLGTARRRVSLRRHARLVDYFVHDGANARAWVQARTNADNVVLDKGTQLFTRLAGQPQRIEPLTKQHEEALDAGPVVFETMHEATLFLAHNEMEFYTWGDERCCLPKGATRATLGNENERLKNLKAGDVLVLLEARNPQNGNAEEADPAHRHAVRLTAVKPATDPLFTEEGNPAQELRVLNVEWGIEDALPFPLCLWDVEVGGDPNDKRPASVALGNIVLADHGLTVSDEFIGTYPEADPVLDKVRPHGGDPCAPREEKHTPPRFQPQLRHMPLTHHAPHDPAKSKASAHSLMYRPLAEFLPAVTLEGDLNGQLSAWRPQRDLLNSNPASREFVVEIENDAAAFVRFGDELFGSRPAAGTDFTADYRVGNGTRGNVGANALGHVVTLQSGVVSVTNPLPARGGREPESFEEVRQNAPVAFRTQQRAVTARDYAEMAERHAGLERAAATFRWTGSWRTVFLTVDRLGGADVDEPFEDEMRRHLERYRMAGHDLEIDGPVYVSLEIEMTVCVKPDYFRGHVKKALLELFGSRVLADGRSGVFHPDNFTFGQTVYLSALYAAAQSIEGVDSVEITKFQRQGQPLTDALDAGRIELERLEIARLDNDPNFPERGVFRLTMKGGR